MRRIVAMVCAVVCAVMGGAGLTAVRADAVPRGCPELYVLAVPGTWANGVSPGILGEVTAGLGPETQVQYVGYDATAFPWEKAIYGKSKAQAVANTKGLALQMLRRCPGARIALVGYSQGADAAGDVASEIGTGRAEIRPSQVAGVVLISDPRRSVRDNLIGPPLRGEGSGGPRVDSMGWVLPRAFTICEPTDVYCNVPRDHFVTRIVGYLAETSDPTPSQFGQYQAEAAAILRELLTLGGPGAIVEELGDERAREQILSFSRFLQSGSHGTYRDFEVRPGVTAVAWSHRFLAGLA
ncbi:cutinase family protein [Gordonia jinghuaiqii]|uniref:Cutinase family protein n=1 Tax=Gordonia jinghuaiqii TaxID=2758710 RepID=A0A7D7QXH3_9ACTN|nr:cutinase family protein [Gordonia jinghuaiqii]MCR5978912.1 cutinase family protein [Gordonia jinghuaiqii]QMT01749.1 cutinase family protein [Gordonia jinghuaiqii]